ncbi:MAG: DUF418 domain-containing protein [bacterium]|nr:DUF418 domain-containing protein [bacterium]
MSVHQQESATAEVTGTQPPGAGGPWAPVAEKERVFTLDALRGVAIFGVLAANVLTFAYPMWTARPPSGGVPLLIGAVVEGKFYVLFSLLFGMGLALRSARAEVTGRRFASLTSRRLAVLLVIGIAHAALLYAGDILAFYAVLAVIAVALRKLSSRLLLAVVMALFVANVVAVGIYAAGHPDAAMGLPPDWERLADERRAALRAHGAEEAAVADDSRVRLMELMADERRIFESGSWWEMTRQRTAGYFLVGAPLRFGLLSWRVLALFVLGFYLVRKSVFLETGRYRRRYPAWLAGGLVVGILLQGAAVAGQQLAGGGVVPVTLCFAALLIGGFIHSLGYAGGVAWLALTRRGRILLRPVAAVGRMALTNYLMGSVVFGFIFYGHGLGLFGRLSPGQAFLAAPALFAVQLLISPLWLRFFRFGPCEWLWRSLTYWQRQPFRQRFV